MAETEEDMDEWIAAICTIKLLDFDASQITGSPLLRMTPRIELPTTHSLLFRSFAFAFAFAFPSLFCRRSRQLAERVLPPRDQ
jgi:hypothetical protein